MSTSHIPRVLCALGLFALSGAAEAAPDFDAGSDGSYGAVFVPANTSVDIPLPPDGVIHATDVTVESGGTLTFTRNVNNTPVYLLSQGDIAIDGTIDVSGQQPTGSMGGLGGPGGFDGGRASAYQNGARPLSVSANQQLLHLVGGRGGNGDSSTANPKCGGGGGGGALLLASDTEIRLDGTVASDGASGDCPQTNNTQRYGADGTSGNLRFVAPRVVGSGTVSIDGNGNSSYIRVDALYTEAAGAWTVTGATSNFTFTEGLIMVGRLSTVPQARIVSVGGQTVAQETGPISVVFPAGSPRTQDVVVELSGFAPEGTVTVTLYQQRSGGQSGLNNTASDSTTLDLSQGSQVTLSADFPALTGVWLDVVVR